MPVFPEELAVGIPEVDAKHRALYAQLDDLHAAMRQHDLAKVGRLVDYLIAYAREHFADEERLMIAAGDPGYPEHAARHREFAEEMKGWRERLTREGPTPTFVVELSQRLTAWLRDHIRKVDGEMARSLRTRGPTSPGPR